MGSLSCPVGHPGIARAFVVVVMLMVGLAWSGSAHAVTAPYNEDFETEPTCSTTCTTACVLSTTGWMNDTTDDQEWRVDVNDTTSSNTGPPTDHNPGTTAGKYLYVETSGTACGETLPYVSNLISPDLDLASATIPAATFWYHMFGSDIGTLHVDVLNTTNGVLQLDVVPPVSGNQGNQWLQTPVIDLSPFVADGSVRIRIRLVHSGLGFEGDAAVDDFTFFDASLEDVGVFSIDSPIAGCTLGSELVTVTLANFGGTPASNFNVQFAVDGGVPVVELFTGTIAPFGTVSFTFASPGNFSGAGLHTLSVSTGLAGDVDPSNDLMTSTVSNFATVAGAFLDDFEGPSAWTAGGTSSTWALGTPSTSAISTAFSGTSAWVTNLTGNYNNSENSFVRSNFCVDFTGLQNPAVRLAVIYESEFSWDGAALQYSLDGGQSWQTVGAFGDPINWYTDNTLGGNPGGQPHGWSGRDATGSGGWLLATHELSALAGETGVVLRIAFGADTSVVDEGFGFDDFEIFDNDVGAVEVTQQGPGAAVGSVSGATDLLVEHFSLLGYGIGPRDIDSVTVTKQGTIADAQITAVKLWADDGDGLFSATLDTLIGTQTLTAGIATFNTMAVLDAPSLDHQHVFVTFDVDPLATTGSTLGASISAPGTDIVTADLSPVTAVNPPISGPLFAIGGVGTPPLYDDFSAAHPNRFVVFESGMTYPQATAAGTTVTIGPATTQSATLEILSAYSTMLPVEGTGFLAIHFPDGRATGALDYRLDLSAFSATTDLLWLQFRFSDDGEEDDPEDNVFISLDGGATWAASLFNFTWTAPQESWVEQTLDVSAALSAASLNYTNDVVIRFQAEDDFELGSDGMLLDKVLLGRPMQTQVDRPLGNVIADAGTDALNQVAATTHSLAYVLRNVGDFPLNVVSVALANAVNVTSETVTGPTTNPIPGQTDDALQVDFTAGLGAFSVDVVITVEQDPLLTDNIYNFTIAGTGNEAIPEIDVQRPAGTSIASGMSDPQGTVVPGDAATLSYTIENLGFADLNVSSVTIENATNATATVTTQPEMVLAPNATTSFDVEYSATANGAFSFDVVVANDDGDENPYTITVNGTADDGMGTGGAGGMGTGGMGTGGMGTGPGTGGTGGSVNPPPPVEEDGGCGCRTPGGANTPDAKWALAALALVVGFRRRRRR